MYAFVARSFDDHRPAELPSRRRFLLNCVAVEVRLILLFSWSIYCWMY